MQMRKTLSRVLSGLLVVALLTHSLPPPSAGPKPAGTVDFSTQALAAAPIASTANTAVARREGEALRRDAGQISRRLVLALGAVGTGASVLYWFKHKPFIPTPNNEAQTRQIILD